ncbi:dTDP-4-dehydrorhamnose 3,5-epimerase [Permianibacter aggregans]|uniref:dTDP-4-dehydrorhamnose 3,5-epimerase n=1 Tax=Permianibacter aggregans TaxID=1510150 RepID=A0A4R6UUW3_9GAMM|nr:dTDP-4-dehydrorhamnose 3,5-epimerase [Permianibacter aggregans]QGX41324.1 dTDP-4-dehydrorhamnose 3,5-epimerase [Permianibacter aggregans]TDQ51110.1 dTDP-4-dehydrorhamnose 3,5-epimerase [Permianibacter aggregans]
MNIVKLDIPEIIVYEPKVFDDERGCFFESFNQKTLEGVIGRKLEFVQDNYSVSKRGVVRGFHFQLPPMAQGKLVHVVRGEVLDVVVDVRQSSPSFGRWTSQLLTSDNRKRMWIPEGFAHGFLVISEVAEFNYKVTNFYCPEKEVTLSYSCIDLDWRRYLPIGVELLVSDKDKMGEQLDVLVSSERVFAQN